MNDYESKQAARRARLEARAAALRTEAQRRHQAADTISSFIPMGQPVLVGHHSERRHHSDLAKMDRHMRASLDAADAANRLESQAAGVGTGGISRDDPDALPKLRAELAEAEARQTKMKQANALIRKGNHAGLAALGYNEAQITLLTTSDRFLGFVGFPTYALTNNSATIRRIKARITALEALPTIPQSVEPITGAGYAITVAENRVCIAFDTRLPKDQYQQLRSHGFLWAPSRKAFVRTYSPDAWYWATHLTRQFTEGQPE